MKILSAERSDPNAVRIVGPWSNGRPDASGDLRQRVDEREVDLEVGALRRSRPHGLLREATS